MKAAARLLLLLAAVLPAPTFATDVEAGLAAVKALGSVNGQALACSEKRVAARARELMLAHAPKTERFGAAYEEATQAGFSAQTREGRACPDVTELTARLNSLAVELAASLPLASN